MRRVEPGCEGTSDGKGGPRLDSFPGGIALRPSDGVLHVSSQSSGEIWRYTTSTGALIVPALETGLYGPGGLAFDAAGATLNFSDPLDAVVLVAEAAIALGVPGNELAVEPLGKLLGSNDERVRMAAIRGLGRIGAPAAQAHLARAAAGHPDAA